MYSDLQTIAPEQYMKTITARLTELYAVSARKSVPYLDLPTPMHSHNIVNVNATHTVAVDEYDEDIYIIDR